MHRVGTLFIALFLVLGCADKGAKPTAAVQPMPPPPPTPVKCSACDGKGKVTESHDAQLPGKITQCSNDTLKSGLIFKKFQGYTAHIGVQNQGDKGGEFKVEAGFVYPGIGEHKEAKSVYIEPHATKIVDIDYRTDKQADRLECHVVPPKVVQTEEKICPVCGGKGLVTPKAGQSS